MPDLVNGWRSEIGHITDDNDGDGDVIKTRCGRTLNSFIRGASGTRTCVKCGTEADFNAVLEENRESNALREAKRGIEGQQRKIEGEKRLETHRRLMEEFLTLLVDNGAEQTTTDKRAAGGSIEFKKAGLNFKLSGNIF